MTDTAGLRVDLGCGANKRAGHVGVDREPLDGVDHVLDIAEARLPFEDNAVDGVFTSHCLEHIADPVPVLREIGRICRHGADVEIWTPHSQHVDAFLFDHLSRFNEAMYRHLGNDHWTDIFGVRFLVHEVTFVLNRHVMHAVRKQGFTVAFAVRHLVNTVQEIGARITVDKSGAAPGRLPIETYAVQSRDPRHRLPIAREEGLVGRNRRRLRWASATARRVLDERR